MGRIFAIMSGKGGVGKSTLAAALAELYARQGRRVVLVDGDTGLRCADLMLNLHNQVIYDLGDLAEKRCELEQALVQPSALPTLSLLAAPQMMRPSDIKGKEMGKIINLLARDQEIILLDAPAGIGRGLKNLLGIAAEPVVVATPDDVSIRDAERLGSLLFQRDEPHPALVLNRVIPALVRRGEMAPPAALAQALDMPLVGVLPESGKIYQALLRHETALHCGQRPVVREIEHIGARLLGENRPLPNYAPSAVWRFFTRGGDRP